MDRKGNLVQPELDEVIQLIKTSNASKFIKNPIKFLIDLEEGKINIE